MVSQYKYKTMNGCIESLMRNGIFIVSNYLLVKYVLISKGNRKTEQ